MAVDNDDYRQKVEEIAEVANELCTEWEINFIESVQEWTGDFTDKQKAVIDRIYEKACASEL